MSTGPKALVLAVAAFATLNTFAAPRAEAALNLCPVAHRPLVIRNATLIDPVEGVSANAELHLVNGKIEWRGQRGGRRLPPGARVIDAGGGYVMPGLVDAHAHFAYIGQNPPERYTRENLGTAVMPLSAAQLLHAGVTSARDPYFPLHRAPDLPRLACADDYPSPRFDYAALVFSGGMLPKDESPMATSVVDLGSVAGKLDAAKARGDGWIKVLNVDYMPPSTFRQIVEQAHARGLRVAAHGLRTGEAVVAAWAGADSIEHTAVTADARFPDSFLGELSRGRTYWIPTLAAETYTLETVENPQLLAQPGLTTLIPPDLADVLLANARGQKIVGWHVQQQAARPTFDTKFGQLAETLGDRLVIGSESGTTNVFPIQATWLEMQRWREKGVDPMRILRAATIGPALLLGNDQVGTLSVGKHGDVIILKRNPLTEAVGFADVTTVIKGGHVFVENGRWIAKVPTPTFR